MLSEPPFPVVLPLMDDAGDDEAEDEVGIIGFRTIIVEDGEGVFGTEVDILKVATTEAAAEDVAAEG